jgi:hypothetical protein
MVLPTYINAREAHSIAASQGNLQLFYKLLLSFAGSKYPDNTFTSSSHLREPDLLRSVKDRHEMDCTAVLATAAAGTNGSGSSESLRGQRGL